MYTIIRGPCSILLGAYIILLCMYIFTWYIRILYQIPRTCYKYIYLQRGPIGSREDILYVADNYRGTRMRSQTAFLRVFNITLLYYTYTYYRRVVRLLFRYECQCRRRAKRYLMCRYVLFLFFSKPFRTYDDCSLQLHKLYIAVYNNNNNNTRRRAVCSAYNIIVVSLASILPCPRRIHNIAVHIGTCTFVVLHILLNCSACSCQRIQTVAVQSYFNHRLLYSLIIHLKLYACSTCYIFIIICCVYFF